MDKKKIIVLTGTPGAGKTVVLVEALERIGEQKVSVLNYADVMLEMAGGIIEKDHDAIRKLPLNEQREMQKKAAEQIASGSSGVTVVDTHCTIKTKNGYLPGMPEWVIKALNPETIVIVEAEPKEIFGRRTRDAARQRDEEAAEEIHFQQEINRMTAFAYAAMCGATVKIIKNKEGQLEEAAQELSELLK